VVLGFELTLVKTLQRKRQWSENTHSDRRQHQSRIFDSEKLSFQSEGGKKCVHMYVNAKKVPVAIITGIRGGGIKESGRRR
jgi:hypothetical protein